MLSLTWRDHVGSGRSSGIGPTTRITETGTGRVEFWTEAADIHAYHTVGGSLTERPGGGVTSVRLGGATVALDTRALGGVALQSGTKSSDTLYDGSTGFSGHGVAAVSMDLPGGKMVALAAVAGEGVGTFWYRDGAMRAIDHEHDGAATGLANVTALAAAETSAAGRILVAASATEAAITVLGVGTTGSLSHLFDMDAADGLPIAGPTAVDIVTGPGGSYVLVAASGSDSITALRILSNGSLRFTDQIVDGLGSRFDSVQAMDWITVEGRVIGTVAGADGGISLLELLPSGRLMHLQAVEDRVGQGLSGIVDLELVRTGTGVDLLAVF